MAEPHVETPLARVVETDSSRAFLPTTEAERARLVNPFHYNGKWTIYEIVKTAIMSVTIAPIRFAISLALFLLVVACSWVSIVGLSKEDRLKPLPKWRRALAWPVTLIMRLIMFVWGFYWIKEFGTKPQGVAPVIAVASHTTIADGFIVTAVLKVITCAVSKAANGKVPILGTLLSATQAILVDKASAASRQAAKDTITTRAQHPDDWPPIMIFPEGTTTNAQAIIQFKTGAFAPGAAVRPIGLRFPWKHFDPTFSNMGPDMGALVWRTLCQFVNYAEVYHFPIYHPSEAEKADPALFASGVRATLADGLGLPQTEHTYDDVRLTLQAMRAGVSGDAAVVEAGVLRKLFNVHYDSISHLLSKFLDMDTDKSGTVDLAEFAHGLNLPDSPYVEHVFDLLDVDGSGELEFTEFSFGMLLLSENVSDNEAIDLCFRIVDEASDGDGRISLADLRKILAIGFPGCTDQDARRLFARLDPDNHGYCTREAFRDFCVQNPEYVALLAEWRISAVNDAVAAAAAGSAE